MADCKWVREEVCVNGECDYVADFCPFYENFDACRFSSQNHERSSLFISDIEKVWHENAKTNPEYAAGVQFVLIEFIKRFRGGA